MRLQVYHTDGTQSTDPFPQTISGTHVWMTFRYRDRIGKAANGSHRLAIHPFNLCSESNFLLQAVLLDHFILVLLLSLHALDRALTNWG